jgi:hypothetical protein
MSGGAERDPDSGDEREGRACRHELAPWTAISPAEIPCKSCIDLS